jgi:large subunit ribosomal protein L18
MNIQALKQKKRIRRKFSVRKNIFGTPERLRLSVYRSLNHISAQIIDDVTGTTLVAASTLEAEVKSLIKPDTKKTDQSKLVGVALAKKALAKDIKTVVFDRNGFLYHGRVKALADGAREAGLNF